jgi:hypothetical protein
MASIERVQRIRYKGVQPRPCPVDFDETFVAIGRLACEEHFHAGRTTINRWLDERGKDRLIALRAERVRAELAGSIRKCPPDFAITYVMLGRNGCERRYTAGHATIDRWIDECGRERLMKSRARQTRRPDRQLNRTEVGSILQRAFPVNLSDNHDGGLG